LLPAEGLSVNVTSNIVVAILALIAWIATLLAVVTLLLGEAALRKARAQDVPEVLVALARIIASARWLGQLGNFARLLTQNRFTGVPHDDLPRLPSATEGSAGSLEPDSPSGGEP
jgi:hypothetical protein